MFISIFNKKNDIKFKKNKNIKMPEIYQDWTPVNIGNCAHKNKIHEQNNHSKNIKLEINDGEMPPKLIQYTHDMIVTLQQARKAKNVTQGGLAKQLNMDSKIIQDIENNKCPYNRKLYCLIMRKLGVNTETLKPILI